MSNIRADAVTMKDPDDDYAFQILKGDVERLRLALEKAGAVTSVATTNDSTDVFTTQQVLSLIANGTLKLITVTVCVDGVEKSMRVLGTTPA